MNFGQTWWGEQWLAAFNGIDYGNRLPRGRSYARKGAASQIEIGSKAVQAQVQGSRRSPYRVTVALPPFSAPQRHQVLETLSSRPTLLSQLLNRQLPAALLPLLQSQGIPLFPSNWDDIQARCSCPDWAVPCKHIAAVIYLIANEIDKDPFLVFQLHGLDLIGAIETQSGIALAPLALPPDRLAPWFLEPQINAWHPASLARLNNLDLTLIPPLGERSFGILSEQTLFHPKNFHALLYGHFKRATQAARRFDVEEGAHWANAPQLTDLTLIVNHCGGLVEIQSDGIPLDIGAQLDTTTSALYLAKSGTADTGTLLSLLRGIGSDQEPLLSPHLLLWRRLLRLALKIVEQQAMVPAAYLAAEQMLIRWRPAPFCEPLKPLLNTLCKLCPPDLVVMYLKPAGRRKPVLHYASASEQIDTALQLLIGYFMEQGLIRAPIGLQQDPISQLFCCPIAQRFDRFETQQHPQVIHHWLMPLYLSQRSHPLSIWIEELASPGDLHNGTEVGDTQELFGLQIHIDSPDPEGERQDPLAAQALGRLLDTPGLTASKIQVLTDLALLAQHFPAVEQLYGEGRVPQLRYDLEAFTQVLRTILPALRALGIRIHLPKALHKLAFPRLSLSLSRKDAVDDTGDDTAQTYLDLEQLLQFNWQIAIGDQRISLEAFQQLRLNSDGLVRLHDQYLMIDDRQLQQLLNQMEHRPQVLSRFELLKAGLCGQLDGTVVDVDIAAKGLFERLCHIETAALPRGLKATLRPYQQRGFEWLAQNSALGFGSLLADDMGLGKTLQVITLILHLKESGQLKNQAVLVVAPTSLLTNWQREIARFAPSLSTQIYHGSERRWQDAAADVILTSYGLVRTDAKTLGKPRWRALIIDEAQNIKNPASQQTKAVKKLKSDIRIGMSGTPVENRLREYWSLFDFSNPGYLGTQKRFYTELASPIEKERDQQRLQQFRQITAPFILRRLKTDKQIISDLPDKLESNRYCSLSTAQAALYQSTVDSIMADLQNAAEGIERRGLIFKLLNALKQICNSPAHYLGQPTAITEESGKLAAFIELMREANEAGEKALIFTQYTRMGELLTQQLQTELGLWVPFLHGGLSRKQRDELVETFQHDHRNRALVLSLKAGGTGLNLTAASQVIHYDLWWNPAVEAQATDRAFRIGQQKRVQVHRLITANSVEEKIDQMIQSKKALADLTVASGEQWLTELSDTELRELISL